MIEETVVKTNCNTDNKSTGAETLSNRTKTRRKFSFKVKMNLKKWSKVDKSNQENAEQQPEDSNESNENDLKQKLTIRKLFRKSSIKKLITNVQRRVTDFNFTVTKIFIQFLCILQLLLSIASNNFC